MTHEKHAADAASYERRGYMPEARKAWDAAAGIAERTVRMSGLRHALVTTYRANAIRCRG